MPDDAQNKCQHSESCLVHPNPSTTIRLFGASETGEVLRGDFEPRADIKHIKPLELTFGACRKPFTFVFNYYGTRYYLVMQYNYTILECEENRLMCKLYATMKGNDESIQRCNAHMAILDTFWPYVMKHFDMQSTKVQNPPKLLDRYTRKHLNRIRLITLEDGTFRQTTHNETMFYPASDVFKNPFPEASTFGKHELTEVSELAPHVLKVTLDGSVYCLKLGNKELLLREVTSLFKMPKHPNLLSLKGVVDAGEEKGEIDGVLMPFIDGQTLDKVSSCTCDQKEKWKTQLKNAVQALHENDVVWSDAKPDNIIIDQMTDSFKLIDFGGGCTEPYVDADLAGTTKGDLQGVERIQAFIEGIPTTLDKG